MPDDEERVIGGYRGWALEMLRVHGVATVLLFAILYGFWRAIQWSGTNVVKPLVERQIDLMNTLEKSSKDQTTVLSELKNVVVEAQEIHKANIGLSTENNAMLKSIIRHTDGLSEENNKMLRTIIKDADDRKAEHPDG